jgi:hypothetical protein
MDKILAAVVAAVLAFTEGNPAACVYATGSTPASTRIYRMGISKYYPEIINSFTLMGKPKTIWKNLKRIKNTMGLL